MASIGQRFIAFIIDLLLVTVVGLVLGYSIHDMQSGRPAAPAINLLGAAYLLLRDITGASVGKQVLGLRVIASDGSSTTIGQRILRNVPLAIGPALTATSSGLIYVEGLASLVAFVDAMFLVIGGARLGDRLAATSVGSHKVV